MTWQKAFISFLVPAVIFVLYGCDHSNEKRRAIAAAFTAEMVRYPQATLIDIYKFFFQGAFGPGHMIPDTAAARRFLENELNHLAGVDSVFWSPVGYSGEYYRVHLTAVKAGSISSEDLLRAFVASANSAPAPSLAEWRLEWRLITSVLESHRGQWATFDADQARLQEMLDRGESVVHHSEIFAEKYQPHYRVIHRRHFEKLKDVLSSH
ncbi:MAG: hypothetical protein ACREOO_16080 [bacterium]